VLLVALLSLKRGPRDYPGWPPIATVLSAVLCVCDLLLGREPERKRCARAWGVSAGVAGLISARGTLANVGVLEGYSRLAGSPEFGQLS